jgi:hypothetical protein
MTRFATRSLSILAGTLGLLASVLGLAAPDDPAARTIHSRPFSVVEFQLGDVPFLMPKDWVDSKFLSISRGSTPFFSVVNAQRRRPPRSTHVEFPPLVHFSVTETAPGLPARNLRDYKAEWDRRWPERQPDRDGFWEWKPREYMLVERRHPRPLDQPLIVGCSGSLRPNSKDERRCTVWFYWTLATGVNYDFYDTDVPPSQWADLDKDVIELLKFLDGREPWPR